MVKRAEERADPARQGGQERDPGRGAQQAPAIAQIREILARGTPEPHVIALLVQEQPQARDQIYELLHQVLGNRFVAEVEAAIAATPVAAPTPAVEVAPPVAPQAAADNASAAPTAMPGPGSKGSAPKPPSPAGSPEAMVAIEDEIAKGIPHPERIAKLAVMLTYADRVKIRDNHLADFEAKLTAAQTIAVYEALGQTSFNTVEAAVRRAATKADLARLIGQLDEDELAEIGEEPDLIRSIRAALPGSMFEYTSLSIGRLQLAQSGPLMRWFVESSTPSQIWRSVATAMPKAQLAETFESEQLWGWVSSLTSHGMTGEDAVKLQMMAEVAPVSVKASFEALVAASPAQPEVLRKTYATEEERAAAWKQHEKEEQDAAAKLLKRLSSSEAISADEVMDGVGAAGKGARVLGGDEGARKKVVALLDLEQLSTFVSVAGFSAGMRLDWLLDKKSVTSSYLLEPLQDGDLESALANDARAKRLHDRLGDDLDLTSVIERLGGLQKKALSHEPLRSLILGKKPSARQLFRFVMAGDTADSISAACKVVGKDFGFQWMYELTSEVEKEEKLRRLVIACPDRAAREHLAKFGIHSWPLEKNTTIAGSVASDPDVYKTEDEHLKADITADPMNVAEDAVEMSADARATMRKDRKQVNAAIKAAAGSPNMGMDAVRTARELDGTLPETLRDVAGEVRYLDPSAFRSYARERPDAEQLEVAGDPKLAALAEKILNYAPLAVLPALRSSAGLAQALRTNPGLLAWIERWTSPLEVLELLGDNAVIAKLTASIMESTKSFSLIKGLPQQGLTAEQRASLARIGAEAAGQKLHEAVGDRLEQNADNDTKKGIPTKPDNGKPLSKVLDELVDRGASPKEFQAACSMHPIEEAIEVLYSRKAPHIKTLRALQVSPLTIFPQLADLPPEKLYETIAMTDWLLATEEPLALLRSIANTPAALMNVAVGIDIDNLGASHFLTFLPHGHGLADVDEAALHAIYSAVTSDAAAVKLFRVRFGHHPEGDWSRSALDKMWLTLAPLPDRQVEMNLKLGGLTHGDASESGGLGGKYTPETGVVTLYGEGGEGERYADAQWQSKEKLAAQLGVDTAEIDRRVDAKLVEKQTVKSVETFRVKVVPTHGFTNTLLHEIGHSVDALLGNRTDLVYGMAGWKSYAGGDFDAWANEMGAWQGGSVSDEDKADTRTLFEQRLQSSSEIRGPVGELRDLAPKDHAVKKPSNSGAFLMKTVRAKPKPFAYDSPVEHNGRMYLMNHYYGRFMSYDAKIHDILPLPYAGFAPAEFFAECYVEYYRDEAIPGGNLPAWVKTWFDENVNRIGHGPAKKR